MASPFLRKNQQGNESEFLQVCAALTAHGCWAFLSAVVVPIKAALQWNLWEGGLVSLISGHRPEAGVPEEPSL